MGSAFARGMVAAGLLRADAITMVDVDGSRLEELAASGYGVSADAGVAVRGADIVLVAVKPWVVGEVLESIASAVGSTQLVISIAAAVTVAEIESLLREYVGVIRAMPNTPCLVGAGAIGFCRGSYTTDEQIADAVKLFEAVGMAHEVPERLMNAVTGLSGSGPAYVYLAIDALADAGVRVGLPRETAIKLAAQTVMGAARMVIESGEHPAKLKDQVATPGGTTIAGIDALERAGFRSSLIEAVKAAVGRAEEMS